MDSMKFSVFWHISFVCVFINRSAYLLSDDDANDEIKIASQSGSNKSNYEKEKPTLIGL